MGYSSDQQQGGGADRAEAPDRRDTMSALNSANQATSIRAVERRLSKQSPPTLRKSIPM
jgi:hypothetical protein